MERTEKNKRDVKDIVTVHSTITDEPIAKKNIYSESSSFQTIIQYISLYFQLDP